MLQESEQTPEQQYQRTEPRRWQTGDLCRFRQDGELALVVDVNPVTIVHERGNISNLDNLENEVAPKFSHNTKLQYDYTSRQQLTRDFEQGFFAPYFEIL